MNDYFIRQGTIGLRCVKFADKSAFLKWHNDLEMRKKIGGIFPFDESSFRDVCCFKANEHPSSIWFAICEEEVLVGIAGFHNIKYIQRNAEIGIFVGENAHRRKKIGENVLKLLEEYAFGMLMLHRLYALVYSDNVPALNFFEKNRWEREGVLKEASYWNYKFRDIVVWAKINPTD